MYEHQRNPRITAARAFIESLDQLHDILAQEHQPAESEPPQKGESEIFNETDSKILEEAAADIDAFLSDVELSEQEVSDEES